jgi:hypothetical protein
LESAIYKILFALPLDSSLWLARIQAKEVRRMNVDLIQELVNELTSSLEDIETQQRALFQFLKDRGDFTDEQFAPYLSQAGKASGVRWRAVRVRLDHLIEGEKAREEKAAEEKKRASNQENQKKEAKAPMSDGGDSAAPRSDPPKEDAAAQPDQAKDNASTKVDEPKKDGADAEGQGTGVQSDSAKDKKDQK